MLTLNDLQSKDRVNTIETNLAQILGINHKPRNLGLAEGHNTSFARCTCQYAVVCGKAAIHPACHP